MHLPPSKHRHLINAGFMLGQGRRRWANIKPVLVKRHMDSVNRQPDTQKFDVKIKTPAMATQGTSHFDATLLYSWTIVVDSRPMLQQH